MEEVTRLPANPDVDVTLTFCDNCNPDWDPENSFPLPEEWAEALQLEVGTLMLRGVHHGDAAEALTQGWQEREYGHLCPVCVHEERERGEGQVMTAVEALNLLTPGKKPET